MPTILQIQNLNTEELKHLLHVLFEEEFSKLRASLPHVNSPPADNEEHLLSQKEAARFLKISVPTFRKIISQKKIKAIRVGNRCRYKRSDLIK